MKVSGKAYIHFDLNDFDVPREAWDAIRAEIGEKSPARMLSEYIYRLLERMNLPVTQVSAVPEQWSDE